jgi:hypothetical protein
MAANALATALTPPHPLASPISGTVQPRSIPSTRAAST